MKKNKIIIASAMLVATLTATFTACSPDYETNFDKSLLEVPHKSQALITFQREGGERTIDVVTNVAKENWNAEANADWCTVEKANDKVLVKAGTYDGYQPRKAVVTVKYGHQEYNVQVIQVGHEATLNLVEDGGFIMRKNGFMAYVEGNETEFIAPVSTNLNIDHILVPDTTSWVHFDANEKLEEDAQGRKLIKLRLDPNKTKADRYCTMTLQSSQNWDATQEFVLIQSRVGYKVIPCYGNTSYEIGDLGGKIRIPYVQNEKDGKWTVTVSDNAASWLHADKQLLSNTDGELSGKVDMNLSDQPRTGTVTLKSENNDRLYVVTIKQNKFTPVPPFNVVNAKTKAEKGQITLTWDQPEVVNYTKLVITMYNAKVGKTVKKTLTDMNNNSVTFKNTFKFAGEYEFTIKTYGPTGMETKQPVTVKGTSDEWSESVQLKLTEDMITANATHPTDGKGIPGLIDNNTSTYYHSQWEKNSSDGKPHRIQIHLANPSAGEFYFDYMGRGNGDGGGDVKRAEIFGSNSGADADGAWTSLGIITYKLPEGRGKQGVAQNHIKSAENYEYLRFVPLARRNKDPLGTQGTKADWFNMSELRLFEVHDEAWAQKNLETILGAKRF